MINATEARRLSQEAVDKLLENDINNMIITLNAKIQKATAEGKCYVERPFDGVTNSRLKEVCIERLEASGFNYIEAQPGESYEPLDYGTPDRIDWSDPRKVSYWDD